MKPSTFYTSIAFTLVLTFPALSYAHHPPTTSRPTTPISDTSASESSRLNVSYRYALYGSTIKNAQTYDKQNLGTIVHHGFSLDGSLVLKSATFFDAQLPFNYIQITPSSKTNSSQSESVNISGFGDASFYIGQGIQIPLSTEKMLFFVPSLGIRLANGSYQSDPFLSKTDVSAGKNGQIDIETYYTNASLGSGAYEALGRFEMGIDWAPLKTSISQSWVLPFTRTEDDILWGIDVSTSLINKWTLWKKSFALEFSLEHRWHLPDEVGIPDSEDQQNQTYTSGARHQLSAGLGAQVFFSSTMSCSLGTNLPLYQNVDGIQLVETISGKAGCGFAFAF